MQLFIPTADSIPVAWGWFQFLLLLTFPLHLLAMNAMVGGLAIGIYPALQRTISRAGDWPTGLPSCCRW